MQQDPRPSTPALSRQPEVHQMPSALPQNPPDDPTSSYLFDWSYFLDFNIDESLNVSFPQSEPEQPGIDQIQPPDSLDGDKTGRVRKRDPRLVCPNFLAGRVPCACPELDEKLDEKESGLPGKKRTRTVRVSGGAQVRCQVLDCEADISELKGYHRRHRVCLRCSNATAVLVDGESKRYCQQCGKFHVLSDFDEGKRSCRRKLERHNNRRRRKPNDPKESMEKEAQHIVLADDVSADDETGKDGVSMGSQIEEREILLDSDGRFSSLCSTLGSHNFQTDSLIPVAASGKTHVDGDKLNPKGKCPPSHCENKSTFSSVCPSGRISFKLYDWNPAEFPRQLRHQIFQWLASMPVELEGYIRPGCTILTAFIAMPKPVWLKLLEEPTFYIKQLVASPGSMLSGRGTMLVYLSDMIFHVTRDATSVMKIKVEDEAPKLHYIYPTCFKVGRPLEFVACGSCLLQPNFRFLISFAGQYLSHNIRVLSLHCEEGDANRANHQLLKIYVPQTDVDLVGPAFIEVENQSGLSNFIPILVCDKETSEEMEILQQQFDTPLSSQEQELSPQWVACEAFALRQAQFSDFILDVAWLLKNPMSERQLTPTHIQRFNYLLNILMEKESHIILRRVLCSLKNSMDDNLVAEISDSDMRLLQETMDMAQSKLAQKLLDNDLSVMPAEDGNFYSDSSPNTTPSNDSATNQTIAERMLGLSVPPSSLDESATVPLLKSNVIMNVNLQDRPGRSYSPSLTRTIHITRSLILATAAIGICFGICAIVLHPQRVTQIIRSCLSNNTRH